MPYVDGPAITPHEFWKTIENAWSAVDGGAAVQGIHEDKPIRSSAAARVKVLIPELTKGLEDLLADYTVPQLRAWDNHFKSAVNALGIIPTNYFTIREREKLGLDPNDDDNYRARMALGVGADDMAFLHSRAFVVAVGIKFYFAFKHNPEGHSLGWSLAPELFDLAKGVYDKRKAKEVRRVKETEEQGAMEKDAEDNATDGTAPDTTAAQNLGDATDDSIETLITTPNISPIGSPKAEIRQTYHALDAGEKVGDSKGRETDEFEDTSCELLIKWLSMDVD